MGVGPWQSRWPGYRQRARTNNLSVCQNWLNRDLQVHHIHGSCPGSPSGPQTNPSSSDTCSVSPPSSQGEWQEGPESAPASLYLVQCFCLGPHTYPMSVPLAAGAAFFAAPETVNSCRAGTHLSVSLPQHRVGSQGGGSSIFLKLHTVLTTLTRQC